MIKYNIKNDLTILNRNYLLILKIYQMREGIVMKIVDISKDFAHGVEVKVCVALRSQVGMIQAMDVMGHLGVPRDMNV